MKKVSARLVALDILIEFEQKKAYSNLLLNHHLRQSQLQAADKRLVTELVYGVIQRQSTLDWVIGQFVKKGVKSLEGWVHQVLRLGMYQLMFLDKIPDRAAVYETVDLAKRRGHPGVVKLVNGVLRAYLRKHDQLTFPDLATKYAYPKWLVTRMEKSFGKRTASEMMKATLKTPKVSVRVNRLKTSFDELAQQFANQITRSSVVEEGAILRGVGSPIDNKWYQQGYYTIQDESSMLVAKALHPLPGMKVLDMCAAPGGKTTHLAELMNNRGSILACDQHLHKVKLIEQQARRLGIEIIQTKAQDMRQFQSEEQFDAILLDAPCSGFGVIQRKPEIKWRRKPQDVRELVELQQALLDVCAKYLKPGGKLVYSTCTWDSAENKQQIEQFLAIYPVFQPDSDLVNDLPKVVREQALHGEGWVQILPHHFESDGFFIARFTKQNEIK